MQRPCRSFGRDFRHTAQQVGHEFVGKPGLGVYAGSVVGLCIVGFFHAVDQRSPLYGQLAAVGFDSRVCGHNFGRHRQ